MITLVDKLWESAIHIARRNEDIESISLLDARRQGNYVAGELEMQ